MDSAVRSKREDLGWKQLNLASAAGVSISTVRRAEQGHPISRLMAKKIAKALGSSYLELGIKIIEIPNA